MTSLASDISQIPPDVYKLNDGSTFTVPKDLNEGHPKSYLLGLSVTVLSAGAFIAATLFSFPLAGPIQLLALGILSAVTYGIINNQLSCRQCIHYYTIGHNQFHQRLLKTEDPTLNGIVWGIHATWALGAIAGVAMALGALATGLVVSQILPFLLPVIALGIGGVILFSHIKAKASEDYWKRPENEDRLNEIFDRRILLPEEGCLPVMLGHVPRKKRAAYMGVGDRNAIGYVVMPSLGLGAIITTLALGILL